MNLLDKLDRKFRRYGIPNITLYLVIGQALVFVAAMAGRFDMGRIVLIPLRVLEGEWWRLITFLFVPPIRNVIFAFFAWYLFYLMGTALENHWGAFRYNVFLLTGWLVTAAASFIAPYYPSTNLFLGGSVFLAFAALYPEFQIYIFFILPVKLKWLALITWIGYGWQLLTGSWQTRLLVLASISNYLLFFGKDILLRVKTGRRKMAEQARSISGKKEAFHRCTACGITDVSHPDAEFRYCPDCGGLGYCLEHIEKHEHQKK
jgi:hypothetical protein